MTFGRSTLTYRELARRIRTISGSLQQQGLGAGDRVLFSVRPGPDAVTLALAIVHARGCVVFADPGAGEALFRARADLAQPRWVAAESLLFLASSAALRNVAKRRGLDLPPYGALLAEAHYVHAGPWLPGVPRGSTNVRKLAQGHEARDQPTELVADDEALIIFTSGTTAAPKGVVHSRASLGSGLADFADGVGFSIGQRVLTDQLMVGVPALIAGAHWIMPRHGVDPGAQPAHFLADVQEADLLYANPAIVTAMLQTFETQPALVPRALKTIVMGGAPVTRALLQRVHELFPHARLRSVYGMTEMLPIAIADGVEKLSEPPVEEGGDSVGVLARHVRAEVRDSQLYVHGPGLAVRYLSSGDPTPLHEVATGDLARIDDGRVTLLGRKKDMFIRGNQNVYPGLYEPLIADLDGIAEAALVGVQDASATTRSCWWSSRDRRRHRRSRRPILSCE